MFSNAPSPWNGRQTGWVLVAESRAFHLGLPLSSEAVSLFDLAVGSGPALIIRPHVASGFRDASTAALNDHGFQFTVHLARGL